MPRATLDFDAVRRIALTLPGVEERMSATRGASSLIVRGKLLTCPAVHKTAEPNSLMVRIGFDRRAELIASDPDVYYVTDHYVNYPAVLVRLSRIHLDSLRDLLGMASSFVGAKTTRGGGKIQTPKRGRPEEP